MKLTESQRTIAGQALLAFAAWTFLAAFSSSQTVVYLVQRGQPIAWGDLLTGRFADWYTCALFTPLFFWLARRYPIDRKSWRTSLPLTLVVTSVCVVLKYSLLVPIEHFLGLNLRSSIGSELSRNFANESMAFWAVIGIAFRVLNPVAPAPLVPAGLAGGSAIASGDGAGLPEHAFDGSLELFRNAHRALAAAIRYALRLILLELDAERLAELRGGPGEFHDARGNARADDG